MDGHVKRMRIYACIMLLCLFGLLVCALRLGLLDTPGAAILAIWILVLVVAMDYRLLIKPFFMKKDPE